MPALSSVKESDADVDERSEVAVEEAELPANWIAEVTAYP